MMTKILSANFLLLEELRNQQTNSRFQNLVVRCQDGTLSCCGILIASVSPLLKNLGKLYADPNDIVIYLPDFTVEFYTNQLFLESFLKYNMIFFFSRWKRLKVFLIF